MRFFPHDAIRDGQRDFVTDAQRALSTGKSILAHAPTGLGKTAAALAPALEHAIAKGLTICFLTSRHTQHLIVHQTIRAMQQKTGEKIPTVSVIAKRHLCAQPGTANLPSDDFIHYCKSLRERNLCAHYINTRHPNGAMTFLGSAACEQIENPATPEHTLQKGIAETLCPYELSIALASRARVIVTDYFYIFSPAIRESFLAKIGKPIDKILLIVDEGHNLPERLRDLQTHRLTNVMVQRAISEAAKIGLDQQHATLTEINAAIMKIGEAASHTGEAIIKTETFTNALKKIARIPEIIEQLETAADVARDQQQQSAISGVATFIKEWETGDEGYSRMVAAQHGPRGTISTITKRCLDPSLLASPVIAEAAGTIVMSGTLTPTTMYADLLGFPENALTKEYLSPFPTENRLALVIPQTTTKYSERSQDQFDRISKICANIANQTPGCSAFYFPSYAIRDAVHESFSTMCHKTVFAEAPKMTREQKNEMLARFAGYKKTGASLLGVASGSFGEGVDMPGVLKSVTVVGLPLDRPDLETKELISYYDRRFGKGWDYGYILPAITRTLQNAGRCIRTEKDHGALLFLDERYAWPRYIKCFPPDWNVRVTQDHLGEMRRFFDDRSQVAR